MLRLGQGHGKWKAGSAMVDGSVDSDRPTWILKAMFGRDWIFLASGPHPETRHLAEEIAAAMNRTDPDKWNFFIENELPNILNAGSGWG